MPLMLDIKYLHFDVFVTSTKMSLHCKNISHNTLIFSNQGISEYNYGFLCSAWVHTQLYSNHVRISGCLHFISHLIIQYYFKIFLPSSSSMCVCTHRRKCDPRSILHAVYFETPSPWVRPCCCFRKHFFQQAAPEQQLSIHTF